MSGRQHPLVLVPRFTTYAGPGDFTTSPVDVSRFLDGMIHMWRSALVGTSPSLLFHFEESTDQEVWSQVASLDPGAGTEATLPLLFTRPLLRARVEIFGGDTVATCYAHGYLLEPS